MGKFKITEDDLKERASHISQEDMEDVLHKKDEILSKCKGRLDAFLKEIKLFFSLIADCVKGDYSAISTLSIAIIVFALLYVLMPVDAIPDIIPILGFTDDALVVALCIACVRNDLTRYEEWKNKQK